MTFGRRYIATLMVGLAPAASALATETRMPLRGVGFVANAGQWPTHVLYAVRQPGAMLWITTSGVTMQEATVTEHDVYGTVTTQTVMVNGRVAQLRPTSGSPSASQLVACVRQTIHLSNDATGRTARCGPLSVSGRPCAP